MAAGTVTGHPTPEAGALKICCNIKADATGDPKATEKTCKEFPAMEDAASFAGGQGMEAQTKRMFMSQENIDAILGHEAWGDGFRQFQARISKELAETGSFEVSEEYLKNVSLHRAMYRGEWSNMRSQYPNLVWEQDEEAQKKSD